MGLAKPALRLIAREHARRPFTGPVLTLGRQQVYATPAEARALLRAEGVTPADDTLGEECVTVAALGGPGRISDVAYFRMLGIREPVRALDYSAFENAEIVHDLNAPVAETLHGCFDLVLDSGTLEHVFDVRQSLANVARLLRPGGRVIHISPANNFANHGLYQFSPTLFFDYYAANGFSGLNGIVFEYDPYQPTARHVWHLFQATPQLGPMTSRGALAVLFVAEKTAASTADRVPLQSFYRDLYAGNAPSLDGRGAGIKQLIPFWLKLLIKKHVPRATPVRRPWGLKALGRVQ